MGSEVGSVDGLDTQPSKAGWCVLDARLVGRPASVDNFSDGSYKPVMRNALRITSQIAKFKGWLTTYLRIPVPICKSENQLIKRITSGP